jgi:hypothetical protein
MNVIAYTAHELEPEVAKHWLKEKIARLAEDSPGPQWSKSARTQLGEPHVAFSNGRLQAEGAPRPIRDPFLGPLDLAAMTLEGVRAYRASLSYARVHLVWRCEPEFEHDESGWSLYVRLAFDPVVERFAAEPFIQRRGAPNEARPTP